MQLWEVQEAGALIAEIVVYAVAVAAALLAVVWTALWLL